MNVRMERISNAFYNNFKNRPFIKSKASKNTKKEEKPSFKTVLEEKGKHFDVYV